MANQSEKQNLKKLEKYGKILNLSTGLFILICVVSLLNSLSNETGWFKGLLIYGGICGLNVVFYKSLMKGLEFGLDYSLYMDLYALTNVVLIISLFTFKIFYIFYAIPLYLLYLCGGKIWQFANKDYTKEQPSEEEMKKMEKKEKKRQRQLNQLSSKIISSSLKKSKILSKISLL